MKKIKHNTLEGSHITVIRHSGGVSPLLPYQLIKDEVLGKTYTLDVSFVSTKISTDLHMKYKKKPGPANTLAFSYNENYGEIVMHLATIRKQASTYQRSYYEHLLFLLIHSCLHLRGYHHGTAMEKLELSYFNKLKGNI